MHIFKKKIHFIFIFCSSYAAAQFHISGVVKNTNGEVLENTLVLLNPINSSTYTNKDGVFSFSNVSKGNYEITTQILGFKPQTKYINVAQDVMQIHFDLSKDVLKLRAVVVTGTFDERPKISSSTAVSVLSAANIQSVNPQGTAGLLQQIAGTFTDAAAGEVFTRVYTRGIAASAEDDMGWYYVSLQEDGLPVSLLQHSYFAPDLFHRIDLTTKKVEAIRGGSAVITSLNAPGGIYNFISHSMQSDLGGAASVSTGLRGNNNIYNRADFVLHGSAKENWFFTVGGHYRHDDGARNADFPFSKGGQLKAAILKKTTKSQLKFYTKYLNDKTNRYTGVAAENWENPTPAYGQNFGSTSLLMPSFEGAIPDGRNLNLKHRFNPAQGVHVQDFTLGLELKHLFDSGLLLKNHTKFSSKVANWQTSISNAFVSLANPLGYFVSGASTNFSDPTFPVGEVVFSDARTKKEVARVNNSTMFTGGFQYLSNGTLPNDAIMGVSGWYKDNKVDEWINQLELQKTIKNHNLSAGFVIAQAQTTHFTQGTFAYVTYEPNPKMLTATLEKPGQQVISLSDSNGLSNYGGLFFENADAKVTQFASFVNDRWEINNNLYADIGLRFERITHQGSKDRSAPITKTGGVDGDTNTAYDNAILVPTADKDPFDFDYSYLSYSLGLNYLIDTNRAIFARFSNGNKAPELNYYFNNFSNVPINKAGEIQKITQAEIGFKFDVDNASFTGTAFISTLQNIGTTNFEFDQETNKVFYTPILANTAQTIGFEWESAITPIKEITLTFDGVLQSPKAKKWNIYDASGTIDVNDDRTLDYSKNSLPFNPKIMYNLGAEFTKNKVSANIKLNHMGSRFGNVANAFTLNAYNTVQLGGSYTIDNAISLHLTISNLFNNQGIANFFGANAFGANANGVTQDFISKNPDSSFVVVPILPRSSLIKLLYSF